VRRPPEPLVVPVRRVVRGSPPEHRSRAASRRRLRILAGRAVLDRFIASPAAHRCEPRAQSCPGTLDRVSPARAPPLTANRRRSPPPSTRVRPPLPDLDPTIWILPSPLLSSRTFAAVGSKSNGSRSSRPGSIPVNPVRSRVFAETPLYFLEFTKIPSHSDKVLTV
jgi:hypothetical protein